MPPRQQQRQRTNTLEWAQKQDRAFEPTCIKLPEGFSFWKPEKPGIYKLDVILYVVGEGNKNADQGFLHFERTYTVHRGIGAQGKSTYACAKFTFGKKCFICDYIDREGNNLDPEKLSSLRPKDRLLMNVIDVTTEKGRKEKQILVLDQPFGTAKHPSFGQIIKNKIISVEDYQNFAEFSGGYTLHCKVDEDSWPGGKFLKISNIEMVARKYEYPESLADKCACLDECIIYTDYKGLEKALLQTPDEEESDEESNGQPPARAQKPTRRPKDEEEEETEEPEDESPEEEEEDFPRKKKVGNVRDSEKYTQDEEPDEEDEPEDDESEEEEDSEDEEPEDDVDEEQEELPTAKSLGIEKGMKVKHEEHGICTVDYISMDGTTVRLKDKSGEKIQGVEVGELIKVKSKPPVEEEEDDTPPPKKKPSRR